MCDCPPGPSLLSRTALADPQHADLITKKECKHLILMGVFQKLQSPEVIFRMTDVLRRHGFKKEYKTLAGTWIVHTLVCLLCVMLQ